MALRNANIQDSLRIFFMKANDAGSTHHCCTQCHYLGVGFHQISQFLSKYLGVAFLLDSTAGFLDEVACFWFERAHAMVGKGVFFCERVALALLCQRVDYYRSIQIFHMGE